MPRLGALPERRSSSRLVAIARPLCVTRRTHSMSADGGDHDLESRTEISASGEPSADDEGLEPSPDGRCSDESSVGLDSKSETRECHQGWREGGVARPDMYPDREWSEECRILIT